MSIQATILTTLTSLVSGRVYDGVVPQGVTALPRITFQQIGGKGLNFVEADDVPMVNGNFQVISWGATGLQASALARQVQTALKENLALYTTILSAPMEEPYPELGLFGFRQDFSFWST
jgi:hypothetical protein